MSRKRAIPSLIAFLIFSALVVISGCVSSPPDTGPNNVSNNQSDNNNNNSLDFSFNVSSISLADKPDYFQNGTYYRYNFVEANESISKGIKPEPVLKKLIENGISVEKAWYKGYSSSCCPPGSDYCMEVIVNPSFLVRLSEENQKMEQFNFIKTVDPGLGTCAHSVSYYNFN